MPTRTRTHNYLARVFHRWPAVEKTALGALDRLYQVMLAPYRRGRVPGAATESASLVTKTDAFNQAAERYFAEFPDPAFMLNKPFSDPHLAGKHLIDAGILIDAMRLRSGDSVGEIGAGSCWLSHMLNRFGCRTVSVDVSPTALALGRRLFERDPRTNWDLKPEFLSYDGHRLPMTDASCDAIVINDAFHHFPNQRGLLAEMHRVLRADGVVAMSEPGRGHAAAETSVEEASSGVLENELVLEDLAALARACGFAAVNVLVASPRVRCEIAATDLGAFMGGKGFASYWKSLCSGLEQHHYVLLYKGGAEPTTRRPGRALARIEAPALVRGRTGAPTPLQVRAINIGDTRWLKDDPGCTRLGAHLYRADEPKQLVNFDWFRESLPQDVVPGTRLTLPVLLPAIQEPGDYLVVFDLVVEGVMWFADAGSSPASVRLVIS